MKTWSAEVKVWLKPSVFDPQGNAVEQALATLGYVGVANVRMGKTISLSVTAADEAEARTTLANVCETVLCNPVIETYSYELREPPAGASA